MADQTLASGFVQRTGYDPVRAAATVRWSDLGAEIRRMDKAGAVDHELRAALAKLADATSAELDRVFVHADWCEDQTYGTRHNCTSCPDYVIGVPRLAGRPVPSATARAWANEEDGAKSVCVHMLTDSEDDGSYAEGWFTPDVARALAAQLIEAADLVDRRRRL
ncbi:hypothetical protein [Amycolatopsis sp. cg13]|uniref:hypothetical protein n=1 Tax=Amycolatopsis sp. cg13 TaxID=3238807 RepID=UPI00352569BF